LSAEGKLMFWDEKGKRYASSLSPVMFDGPGSKLFEVAWNGSGNGGACVLNWEGASKDAFQVVMNAAGAQPLSNGSVVNITKSAQSFFVKYTGPKSGTADMCRLVLKDPSGKILTMDLVGTKKGGAPVVSNNSQTPAKVGVVNLPKPADKPKPVVTDPKPIVTAAPKSPAKVQEEPKPSQAPSPVSNSGQELVSPDPSSASAIGITDTVLAKQFLDGFLARHRGENLISVGEVFFKRGEELFETQFKLKLDSLVLVPEMFVKPIWVAAIVGSDSIVVPMSNVTFKSDSLHMTISLPDETVEAVAVQDSFQLKVGFSLGYLAGPLSVYPSTQPGSVLLGSTIARIYAESHFWMWFWIVVIISVLSFFLLGFLWIRRPVNTFRYLRESRYQRDRYIGRDEDVHIEIETVHLDFAKRDVDLVQLAFNIHDQPELGSVRDEVSGKVRALDASMPVPVVRGLKRFFVWFYGIFGVSKEPRFRSVYYSLRIEPIKGGIPQNLRVKDESGLFMLGTSLTGNVLATDHQDFRFTKRPFQYRIFFDPSEILDYSGTMKTVSIPFRVTEEPFEGYVMTRDFRLNLEVQAKA